MFATSSTCYDVIIFLKQWGKSASNFVAISSLVVKLLKKCRVSVASGTPYITKYGQKKEKNKKSQHPFDKWVKMRHKVQEAAISRKMLIQKVADFLQKVLPCNTPLGTVPKIEKPDFTTHPSPLIQTETDSVWVSPSSLPSTSLNIYMRLQKGH